ncbi:MAG TPA: ABC transporter permease subunit [Methanoregulaceae archaeon]|nr:ABC transporter permease subunit [Methanoregulaceae archaeon]
MRLSRLRVVATKEFHDHLTSRRFLLIAVLLLLVVSIGLVGGMINYRTAVDRYAGTIGTVGESSADPGSATGVSLLDVFNSVGEQILLIGAILGIAMGFDLVTREKEGGSLKLLLSHPIYRDEVINGKGLGGIGAIAGLIFVTFAVVLGVLLAFGVVPDGYEAFALVVLGLATLLLVVSYFSVALFISTISRTGGTALVAALVVFIVLSSLLPVFVDPNVVGVFMGPPPAPPSLSPPGLAGTQSVGAVEPALVPGSGNGSDVTGIEESQRYERELQAYEERRLSLEGVISLFSPTLNFRQVMRELNTPVLTSVASAGTGSGLPDESPAEPEAPMASVPNVVESILPNLIALLVIPALFFGLAYARFMRMDIR